MKVIFLLVETRGKEGRSGGVKEWRSGGVREGKTQTVNCQLSTNNSQLLTILKIIKQCGEILQIIALFLIIETQVTPISYVHN
ncbi:MAG: hypothetical protein QNJ51_06390 [Calothrix sp. MO_167.B12]|nr:hypothetical protein [Calothrix sp. MO_167.B12]